MLHARLQATARNCVRRQAKRTLATWSPLSSNALKLDEMISQLPEALESEKYLESNRFSQAADSLQRVFEICEHSIGPSSPITVSAIKRTSEFHFQGGKLKQAEALLKQCIKGQNSSNAKAELELLLARNLCHQHNLSEAKEAAKRAGDGEGESAILGKIVHACIVSLQENSHNHWNGLCAAVDSEPHSDYLKALTWQNRGASTIINEKDTKTLAEAREYWKKGLSALPAEEDLSSLSPAAYQSADEVQKLVALRRGAILANLGQSYLLESRHDEASENLVKALKVQGLVLPETDLRLARTVSHLAHCYQLMEQAVNAEGLFTSSAQKFRGNQYLSISEREDFATLLEKLGLLISQWEKRETEANAVKAEAEHQRSLLPKDSPHITSYFALHIID